VTIDAAYPHGSSGPHKVVAAGSASPADLVRCGAELVALSERFYHRIFVGALGFVGLSTLTALAFLPLRASATAGRPPLSAVVAALVVLCLTGLAIWRVRDVYRVLRRWPQLELVPVLIAAVLLSIVSPLRNELWWSACAILMVLATLASLRRALLYCLIVLIANLTAHVVAGDLRETSTVGILGLWIGMPFWTAVAAVIPDRMAAHILRINTTLTSPPGPPRRVQIWTTQPFADARDARHEAEPDPRSDPLSPSTHDDKTMPPTSVTSADETSRLTARQLQVVALLADGHRYRDIAACLSISAGQVHRHVANAVTRLGVDSVNELVTIAVAEGMVPSRTSPAAKAQPIRGRRNNSSQLPTSPE